MSRTIRQRFLAGVGVAMLTAGLPLLALADTQISARGWTHGGFGRLVLDRAARIATGAEIKGDKLIVTFSEPVSVDLTGALRFLNTYVDGPVAAQGRTIELDLVQPVTLNRWIEEGKLVLDLRPTGSWSPDDTNVFETGAGTQAPEGEATPAQPPQVEPPLAEAPTAETPKAEAAPAAEAPKAETPNVEEPRIIRPGSGQAESAADVSAGPPTIVARHGDHGTFMRLAIDWPSRIDYRVRRDGDRIEVAFTAPATIDLARARRNLPKELAQIAATNDQVAHIYLTLAQGASLRDFRLGRTVVLDIMRPASPTTAAPPLRLPEKAPEIQQAAASPAMPAVPEAKPEEPAASGTLAAAPAAETPASQESLAELPAPSSLAAPPQAEPAPEYALQSLPAMPEAAPAPVPAVPEPAPPADQPGKAEEASQPTPPPMPAIEQAAVPPRAPVDVQIRVAPAEDGTKIMFAWPEAVAAAAFRRNGALWLAFDRPSNDVKSLFEDARVARLGKPSKLDVPDATIIRIVEAAPLGVSLTASGKAWIVDLTPGGKHTPVDTIEQRRESLADGASSLLLRANLPGRVASVTDPAGGVLHIVPVRQPGLGIADQVGWPEFQLLPSYQGVVVASLDESITVDSLPQGIVVTTRPRGELEPIAEAPAEGELVAALDDDAAAQPQETPTPSEEVPPVLASVPGLFDLPTWRRGGEATFRADQRSLQETLTDAGDETDKAAARMALGEFYFAHGLVDEAESALSEIGTEGRSELDQRRLALLVGAVQVLDGQLEKARAMLADKSLAGVAEANLFLGLLAAGEEKWDEAAKHLTSALPNIADYPKPIRETIYLAGGAALNHAGNPIGAQRFADALRQDQPARNARDRLAYLDGHIKLKAGDRDEALALWASLADSSLDDVRARSQFDLVEERLKGGELAPADAIAPLEALRFVNRGGNFEFKLLRKLGTLYLGDDQPRRGLVALRDAAANFPGRPEAKEVGEQMSAAFRQLYLEDGADRLSPLTAIALYDEFRELTPAGADGDRMMSLLADRLVKVDLLGRAAELLDGLVQKRLTGLDKAYAGTRLAAIRMLDRKPELALKALEGSAVDDVLPPDLVAERRRLEARATFDTGDTLGGMRMLAADDSLEAKWLRADMQWRTREWPAAADALEALIAGEEQAMAAERAALKVAMDPRQNPAASVRSPEAEEQLAAKQLHYFKKRVAPLVLNRAVALSLASDRRGLKALANQYGARMKDTDQAAAFSMLTTVDNGLVESVSAELAGVDRIDAFVTDYNERLKKVSLGEPESQSGS